MARKGKAWGPSSPLWRWRPRGKRGKSRAGGGPKRRGTRRRTSGSGQRRKPSMARRRYSRRRARRGMKIPIVSLAILAGQAAYANSRGGDLMSKVAAFGSLYTGYNLSTGAFEPQNLAIGYGPWLLKRFIMPVVKPRI